MATAIRTKPNIDLQTASGLLSVVEGTRPIFSDCFAGVELSDGTRFTTEGAALSTTDGGIVLHTAGDFFRPELRWHISRVGDKALELVLEVENKTGHPLSVERLDVFISPNGFRRMNVNSLQVAQTGWMSWSFSSPPIPVSEHLAPAPPPVIGPMLPPTEAQRMVLPWMTQLRASGHGALIGFTTGRDQAGVIHLQPANVGHRICASSYAEGVLLENGATMRSERLLVMAESREQRALESYAAQIAGLMAATPAKTVTTGWCSWYHFYTRVSEADVLANLSVLEKNQKQMPVEVVQLDDGYQTAVGDWLSLNEKFPSGMPFLTDKIHNAGFDAGLWLAPFIASEQSEVYKQHPDWFLRDHNGMPINALHNWGTFNFALDVTHPEVEAWLEQVFMTIVNDWRFDYLKIDFIYAAAMRGVRYDKNCTSVQAYRRALELVRRVAGERFVLGCGAVFLPSVGLVDGMRIGSDTAEFWSVPDPCGSAPALVNAIRATLAHGWMHGTLWVNDPDCLIVRENNSKLTIDEVRSWSTAIAMSGGMTLLSDDLSQLEPDRMAIIPRLLPPAADVAVPSEHAGTTVGVANTMLMAVERPWENWLIAAVYNWNDSPRSLPFDIGKAVSQLVRNGAFSAAKSKAPTSRQMFHVVDLWTGDYFGTVNGDVRLPVTPAHGVRLLALHPVLNRPQLLGTTFHLLGGAAELSNESWDGRTLTLNLSTTGERQGELIVFVPAGYAHTGVSDEQLQVRKNGQLLRISMVLQGERQLKLAFKKGS